MTKPAKITSVFVNEIQGWASVHVKGSITRLDKGVSALMSELRATCPEGCFTVPPKAQWRYYVDCNGVSNDAYEIRLRVNHSAKELEKALYLARKS